MSKDPQPPTMLRCPPLSALLPYPALAWDLLVVLASGVAVQVVFPERADWVAHVVAGGGLAVVINASLSKQLGSWAQPLGAAIVLVGAIVADATLTGPFDAGDVAFTLAGALLVTGTSTSGTSRTLKWTAIGWGIALTAVASYYRYGIRRGP